MPTANRTKPSPTQTAPATAADLQPIICFLDEALYNLAIDDEGEAGKLARKMLRMKRDGEDLEQIKEARPFLAAIFDGLMKKGKPTPSGFIEHPLIWPPKKTVKARSVDAKDKSI